MAPPRGGSGAFIFQLQSKETLKNKQNISPEYVFFFIGKKKKVYLFPREGGNGLCEYAILCVNRVGLWIGE